jgi:hypothetical protein
MQSSFPDMKKQPAYVRKPLSERSILMYNGKAILLFFVYVLREERFDEQAHDRTKSFEKIEYQRF